MFMLISSSNIMTTCQVRILRNYLKTVVVLNEYLPISLTLTGNVYFKPNASSNTFIKLNCFIHIFDFAIWLKQVLLFGLLINIILSLFSLHSLLIFKMFEIPKRWKCWRRIAYEYYVTILRIKNFLCNTFVKRIKGLIMRFKIGILEPYSSFVQ